MDDDNSLSFPSLEAYKSLWMHLILTEIKAMVVNKVTSEGVDGPGCVFDLGEVMGATPVDYLVTLSAQSQAKGTQLSAQMDHLVLCVQPSFAPAVCGLFGVACPVAPAVPNRTPVSPQSCMGRSPIPATLSLSKLISSCYAR
jgi:hypothetical protein